MQRSDVDVVALQETKCKDEQFPRAVFEDLGYEVAHFGHSQWNGVAILSRVGPDRRPGRVRRDATWGEPAVAEARALGATCGGIRIWSLYVPNGRTLEDPHLAYKLEWLAALRTAGQNWLAADPQARIALVGDWNVAPRDEDVWNMAAFEGSTHVSAPERAAFDAVVDAGFADVVRPLHPEPGTYTLLGLPAAAVPAEGRHADRLRPRVGRPGRAGEGRDHRPEERKGKGASDHAPVIVELT